MLKVDDFKQKLWGQLGNTELNGAPHNTCVYTRDAPILWFARIFILSHLQALSIIRTCTKQPC